MDLRIFYGGICIFLQMIVALTETHVKCRMCKPGYYSSRICSDIYDTVCKPCSVGTFSPVHNMFNKCSPCSKCDVGEFILKECTKRSDTVCESCSAVSDHVSEHFLKECLQSDDPGVHVNIGDTSEDVLQSDTGDAIEGRKSSTPLDTYKVIYDGSGVSTIEEDNAVDNVFKLENETTVEEESSGESPIIDITDGSSNITAVIYPDDGDDEKDNVTEKTTTAEPGIIVVGPGIKLSENDTKETDPDVKTTTTEAVVIKGEVVEDTDVIIGGNFDDDNDEYEHKNNNEDDPHSPHTGASKRSEEKSKGTSIGVVVTIGLVAALVFFILGFLVSRYWSGRRERTFNVLEAERRNGKAPVECSTIEYKDKDNNIRGKPSIYDEIPADTKHNGNGAGARVPAPVAKVTADPVYSKPIKRNSVPPTDAAPPEAEQNDSKDDVDGEWAGFSVTRHSSSGSLILLPEPTRPVSEIKYIDEEAEEKAETDQLLPQPSTSNDVTQSASDTSDKETDDKSEPEMPTEETPMIQNEPDNKNS